MFAFIDQRTRGRRSLGLALLLMGISMLLLSTASVGAQAVQDVPVRFLPAVTGRYGIAQDGVGLFGDVNDILNGLSAGNIDMSQELPLTCAGGSTPNIEVATLTWVHRMSSRNGQSINDQDPNVSFGPVSGSIMPITAPPDRIYSWQTRRGGRTLIYVSYNADVTAIVQQSINVSAERTFRIEAFDEPTQFGAGLQIFYECPELPVVEIQRSEGNDFYYVSGGSVPDLGPDSQIVCKTIEPDTIERTALLGLQTPGSANKLTRFTVIWYATGTGTPPATIVGPEPQGVYVTNGVQRVNLGVITQPSPAEEWDGRVVAATIRPTDTWICLQGESPSDAEYPPSNVPGENTEGASGMIVGATFSIPSPVQPPVVPPVIPPDPPVVPPDPPVIPPDPPVVPPDPPVVPPDPPVVPTPTTVPSVAQVVPGEPVISKAVSSPFAIPGQTINWTVTVTNTTSESAPNVAWTDVMPSGLQIISAGPATVSGQTVTYNIGTMAPGDAVTITIVTRISTTIAVPFVIDNLAALDGPYSGVGSARVLSITGLPQTGETPWYRSFIEKLGLFLLVAGMSFTAIDVSSRLLPRQRVR